MCLVPAGNATKDNGVEWPVVYTQTDNRRINHGQASKQVNTCEINRRITRDLVIELFSSSSLSLTRLDGLEHSYLSPSPLLISKRVFVHTCTTCPHIFPNNEHPLIFQPTLSTIPICSYFTRLLETISSLNHYSDHLNILFPIFPTMSVT